MNDHYFDDGTPTPPPTAGDVAVDVIVRIFGLIWAVGVPLVGIYLLVQFVKWSWGTP
jgi:hypothetical protein